MTPLVVGVSSFLGLSNALGTYTQRNPTEVRWVHNQKENCHYDSIPFGFKGIRRKKITLSVVRLSYKDIQNERWAQCDLSRWFAKYTVGEQE